MASPNQKKSGKRPPPPQLDFNFSALSPTAQEFNFGASGAGSAEGNQPATAANPPTTSDLLSPRQYNDGIGTPRTPRTPGHFRAHSRDVSAPATPAVENSEEPGTKSKARLVKQKKDYAEELKASYDKWGEETEKVARLEEQLADSEKERKRLAQVVEDQSKEVNGILQEVKDVQKELEQIRKEKQQHEGDQKKLQTKFNDLTELLKDTESTLKDTEKMLSDADVQRDDFSAKNAGLQEELDGVETNYQERETALQQNADAQQQLDKVLQTFHEEFSELSKGLNIDDYLKQFRETVQGSRRLRRDESQTSLASGFGESYGGRPGVRGNRQVSSASIGDELRDQGVESGEESEDEHAQEQEQEQTTGDADDTLKDIDVGNVPHAVNNWAPSDITHGPTDDLFGEYTTMGTQTPGPGDNLQPDRFPRKNRYVDAEMSFDVEMAFDADTWDGNNRGTQTTYVIPNETVADIAKLRADLAQSQNLHRLAQADVRTKDKKFQDQFYANLPLHQEIKKLKGDNNTLNGQVESLQYENGPLRQHIAAQNEHVVALNKEIHRLNGVNHELRRAISQEQLDAQEADMNASNRITDLENALKEQRSRFDEANAALEQERSRPQQGPATAPAPAPQPSMIYVPVSQQRTGWEMLSDTPAWLKLLSVLLFGLWVALMAQVLREKHVWFSANELRHQQLVAGPLAPSGSRLWTLLGEYVGEDPSLLG